MKTGEDRLRFLVDLSNADLDSSREGDRINLLEDLNGFLLTPAGGVMGLPFSFKAFATADLAPLQKRLKEILGSFLGARDVKKQPRIPGRIPTARQEMIPIAATYCPTVMGDVLGPTLLISAEKPTDLFILLAMLLLVREPTMRVRVCPECRKYFFRSKRQVYCSNRCGNRLRVRKYRAEAGDGDWEEAESLRNHENYKRRQPEAVRKRVKRRPRPHKR